MLSLFLFVTGTGRARESKESGADDKIILTAR